MFITRHKKIFIGLSITLVALSCIALFVFGLLWVVFCGLLAIIPFMRRVRAEPAPPPGAPRAERVEALPAPTD